MNLNEKEKQLIFQLEGYEKDKVINELSNIVGYTKDKNNHNAALSLLKKFCGLPESEVMSIIKDIQMNYRLSHQPLTIGEQIAVYRQQTRAEKLRGHDIMDLNRFAEDTRHMAVFIVLTDESNIGSKGDKMRLFLTDKGYEKLLDEQQSGHVLLKNHAKVRNGHLLYDNKNHDL